MSCHNESCSCNNKKSGCGCSGCGSGGKSCGCGCSKCSCGEKKSCGCGCSGCKGESCKSEMFLKLADEAWMCVLKDKMKEHIKQNCPYMDELAKMVTEANNARWKHKEESENCCGDFDSKLESFFKTCKKK